METRDKPVKSLEAIIESRRSVRNFSKGTVPKADMKKIIQSAIYAPYAGATGIPLKDIRKIFLFSQDTESMTQARDILLTQIRKKARVLKLLLILLPFLRKKMTGFLNVLHEVTRNGIPSLHQASCYVVIAEKKGFPPVGKQSIAHALQNMWLTATDLGLGFHLVSATGILSKNKQFLNLLGLPEGDYELDGCVIGVPAESTDIEKNIDPDDHIIWMK
ncbi:nitroreductase family protein [bacterium]|nr:nitroreductase family protein [candidate division CSSED10-310 bacterium]